MWSTVGICGEKCVTLRPNTVSPASEYEVLGKYRSENRCKGQGLPACRLPQSVWNERMDTLRRRLSRWNRRDQMIYRQYVTDVEMITLDGNGRFLIPKRYMKMADINQQIRFTGMDDCIEIWANGEESEPFLSAEEFSKAMEETMGTGSPFLPDGHPADRKSAATNEPAT